MPAFVQTPTLFSPILVMTQPYGWEPDFIPLASHPWGTQHRAVQKYVHTLNALVFWVEALSKIRPLSGHLGHILLWLTECKHGSPLPTRPKAASGHTLHSYTCTIFRKSECAALASHLLRQLYDQIISQLNQNKKHF